MPPLHHVSGGTRIRETPGAPAQTHREELGSIYSITVAVLLAAETRVLSISVVDSAALAIHRCTLSHVATVEMCRKRWWVLRLLATLTDSSLKL